MNWCVVITNENLEIHANVKTQSEADQIIRIIEVLKRMRWPLNTVTPTIVRTDRRDDAK